MHLPGDGPLGVRLLLWVVVPCIVVLAILLGASAYLTHQHMIGERVGKLRALVDVTHDLAAQFNADVVAGRVDRTVAIDRFRTVLYGLRYDGRDYMFAYDFDGRVIALGNNPDVQGEDRLGMLDDARRPFIQQLLAAARNGGGTVEYQYQRGPGQPSLPKLAYVRAFLPWNMFIGTGVYIDDVEAAFHAYLRAVGVALAGALAVASALAFWIGRYITAASTERRAAEARIVHLAHHDTLTDLPNRALLQDRLAQAAARAALDPSIGAGLLLCDLDRFKAVNDTFGHPTGDELLRQVAQRMRNCVRKVDTLARLGGDEFAIVMLECRHRREAEAAAARIVSAVGRRFDVLGHSVSVGVSIGIALAPGDATDPADLMKLADTALYISKHRGRGMATSYIDGMSEGLRERHDLEADLRRAIGANEFEPYFQPIVDLRSRGIVGFEALFRWHHPTRGVLGPEAFLDVAEQCGLMVPLGERILRVACLEAASWPPGIRLAVNLSSQQIHASRFFTVIREALTDTGLAADQLELEVTEAVMLGGGDLVRTALSEIRACGSRVALDDFGAGQMSLSCIQSFPIDRIRIDASVVRALGTDTAADVIVGAVVSLGALLGVDTLAEGIATPAQAGRVLAARCTEGQGDLFGPAVPAAEVADVIRRLGQPPEAGICFELTPPVRFAGTAGQEAYAAGSGEG